jgi:uncharacterized protein (TIGR04222 family)
VNPLDLPGPQFLAFYLFYGATGLAVAVLVRRMLAAGGTGGAGGTASGRWAPGAFPQEGDAYAVACLRGSRVEASRTVLGFLLAAKLIAIEKAAVIRLPGAPVAADLMPIERQGLDAIGTGQSAPLVERQVSAALAGPLSDLECDLASAGLTWSRRRQALFRWLRHATLAAILGMGLAKLGVAIVRGRLNVGGLLALMIVYAGAILLILEPPVVTAAGKRYLDWLRQSHAGLLGQVAHGRPLQPRQVALAAAIFGARLVPPLVPLMAVVQPPLSRTGGGDSGSSFDGGGGGGGCGGGGGGGCGGCGSS